MTTYDILSKAILQVSNTLNKKALNEVINDNTYNYDLNDILFKYYLRVHRRNKPLSYYIHTFDKNDKEDLQAFNEILKDLKMKRYKKDYNYKEDNKIKQKNTYCIVEYNNGFISYGSYALNVYDFIEAHDIVEDL
jgi:replicative superfamily II helicase